MSNDWNCFQPFRMRFILFQTHSHLKSWYIIILFAQGHLPTAVYRHSLVAWQPSAVELTDDMRYQHVIAASVLIPLNQHVWPLCTRPSTCKPNRIHTIRAENQYHGSRTALLCTGECQKQGTLLGMCLPSLRMTDSVGTLSLQWPVLVWVPTVHKPNLGNPSDTDDCEVRFIACFSDRNRRLIPNRWFWAVLWDINVNFRDKFYDHFTKSDRLWKVNWKLG